MSISVPDPLRPGRETALIDGDDVLVNVHAEGTCLGQFCCIHRPSDHPLRDAPMLWSQEIQLMFRRCEHGAAHPDPDAYDFLRMQADAGLAPFYDGWHPCCEKRCCRAD